MNLYQLTKEYNQLFWALEQYAEGHEGEISEELEAMLNQIEGEREEKMRNIARLILNTRGLQSGAEAELKRLKRQRERLEAFENRLLGYLDTCLLPGEVQRDEVATIKRDKCPPSVEIVDAALIPPQFVREKVIREPDKREIKDALQSGGECPGAVLVNDKYVLRVK